MTIELVDGKAGTAHISSEDKAIIHQAKFGAGDMVFEWGDAMSCTMQSANKAVIGTGCASIQGLDWHITNAETVTIQSGVSGKNRNDIICAHYHREASTGIEKVELMVFKGTPSDGTAVDPTVPSAKILNGAADAYMPLWRIPLTGITAGTPVRLFNKRFALWDSVTQQWKPPYTQNTIFLCRVGRSVTVNGNVKFVGSGVQNYTMAVETIPEAFRPLADQSIISFPSCGFSLLVMRDGKVQMLGDPKSAYSTAHGCWMALQ